MKRSEIVNNIAIMIDERRTDTWDLATNILDMLEANGMLPPVYEKQIIKHMGEGTMYLNGRKIGPGNISLDLGKREVNEWEEEEPQLPKSGAV